MTAVEGPQGASARLHVLFSGYVGRGVASTVTYLGDGDVHVVVDPGMVPDRRAAILDPLAALGVTPEQVTDVVLSHHHPDHTVNVALFPDARVHDHWAAYKDDTWDSRAAEGVELSPSIRLIETPGHTPQDITTLVGTPDGLAACTHLWWTSEQPLEDPFATDPAALHANRDRVLAVASLIVPGHGEPFAPSSSTPR